MKLAKTEAQVFHGLRRQECAPWAAGERDPLNSSLASAHPPFGPQIILAFLVLLLIT